MSSITYTFTVHVTWISLNLEIPALISTPQINIAFVPKNSKCGKFKITETLMFYCKMFAPKSRVRTLFYTLSTQLFRWHRFGISMQCFFPSINLRLCIFTKMFKEGRCWKWEQGELSCWENDCSYRCMWGLFSKLM